MVKGGVRGSVCEVGYEIGVGGGGTRFWSLSIFLTEKASAMVTASGSPSGTCRERTASQVMSPDHLWRDKWTTLSGPLSVW